MRVVCFATRMGVAIEFDRQTLATSGEIYRERTNRYLAGEFPAFETVAAQDFPKSTVRRRHLTAQSPGTLYALRIAR